MVRLEHNGRDFHYIVGYKRRDSPADAFTRVTVSDWRQSEYIVHGQETYHEYEIYVQAVNSHGAAQSNVETKIGYSGEDGLYFLCALILSCYSNKRKCPCSITVICFNIN